MVGYLKAVFVSALILVSVQGSLYNFYGDTIGPSVNVEDESNQEAGKVVAEEANVREIPDVSNTLSFEQRHPYNLDPNPSCLKATWTSRWVGCNIGR